MVIKIHNTTVDLYLQSDQYWAGRRRHRHDNTDVCPRTPSQS